MKTSATGFVTVCQVRHDAALDLTCFGSQPLAAAGTFTVMPSAAKSRVCMLEQACSNIGISYFGLCAALLTSVCATTDESALGRMSFNFADHDPAEKYSFTFQ